MKQLVTIKTETIGQNFGTIAIIKRGKNKVHETEVVGLGFTTAAIQKAKDWCDKNNYSYKS